jgi:hypothetical protein
MHLINLKNQRIEFNLLNELNMLVLSGRAEPKSDYEIFNLKLPQSIIAGIYFFLFNSETITGVRRLTITGK